MDKLVAFLVLILGGLLIMWLESIGVGWGILSVAVMGLLILVGKIASGD